MRLFIFESHPIQYYAPIYRELHSICRRNAGTGIHVFYATDISLRGHFDPGFGISIAWDENLLDGYPATVLNAVHGKPLNGFSSLTRKGIWNLLASNRPEAVLVTNFLYEFDWAVMVSAVALRVPIWFRADTHDFGSRRSPLKKVLRYCAYRALYRAFDQAVVRGELNSQHFAKHGIPTTRQILSPHCVVDRFAELSEQQKLELRHQVRLFLGIPERINLLLFCGKLQPQKNPSILLEALSRMPVPERQGYAVLFVGAGELEPKLKTLAASISGLSVFFAGFKNQKELPAFYLASDALVLPSHGETWGLVVNEALLAERKVILSHRVGCHPDFSSLSSVRVFDGTIESLLQALRAPWAERATVGQREFMRRFSIRAAAEAIAAAMGVRVQQDNCDFNVHTGNAQQAALL